MITKLEWRFTSLSNLYIFFIFSELPNIPELDIAFALSATAVDGDASFRRMKETIKSMIDQYGTNSIRYGVIVFGRDPSVELLFSKEFPTDNELKRFFDGISRDRDGSSIHRYEIIICK